MSRYSFPSVADFLDRAPELDRLRSWWEEAPDPLPLVLHGRRRTGKSWLLRRFAHGREADIFVCDSRSEADQLGRFASQLAPSLGFRPALPDPHAFFSLLLRMAAGEPRLAIIDELPLLLTANRGAASSLATALEEHLGSSRLRLVLCGSQVGTMQTLLAERGPLHGRGHPLLLRPLRFAGARLFLAQHSPAEAVVRHAIAGGMPLYLRRLGRPGPLQKIVCEELLDPLGPLFDEPREVLMMELTSTADHFSLLGALADRRDLGWNELVSRSGVESSTASRCLQLLQDLHLVSDASPMFAPPAARRRRYRVTDPLMRFWFRFVFPFQADLAAGLSASDHYRREVEPGLPAHTAIAFEEICRDWVRHRFGTTTESVGAWWGPARHDLRRHRVRMAEEIDVVGGRGRTATVIGECRWRSRPMGRQVLDDLLELKVPAMAQSGVDVTHAAILLFSRSGFAPELLEAAAGRPNVRLVSLEEVAGDLSGEAPGA